MRSTIRTTIAALGAVAALALSACGGSEDDSPGDDTTAAADETGDGSGGDETESESADVFDVAVGDCIAEFATDEEVSDVTVIPCDQEHDQEVYAIFEVEDGEFPGTDAFEAQVQEDCVPEFSNFVGMAYEESVLGIKWLEPTETSWAEGDRELVCTVLDPEGPVTGTLEGANR